MQSIQEIFEYAKKYPSQKIAVVAPEDDASLEAIGKAIAENIAEAIFVGDRRLIEAEMEKIGMTDRGVEFVQADNHDQAAAESVRLVAEGRAHLLMKGTLHTDQVLRAVLDKTAGLRTGSQISHAFLMQSPSRKKMFALTDVAMNIAPDLGQKVQILQNTVNLMHDTLGIETPKAAILAAVETVNPKMPATLDAAYISKMAQRGQIKNVIADGPLALDNAVSAESAKIKGIVSPVAGDADIFLVPDIEAGNILYKGLTHLADYESAGIILGAKVPVILTSRADSMETKLYSIALCAVASMKKP